jgi:hypothetical protein
MAESGRGLYLVTALAEDFAILRRSRGGSHARAVLRVRDGRAPRAERRTQTGAR